MKRCFVTNVNKNNYVKIVEKESKLIANLCQWHHLAVHSFGSFESVKNQVKKTKVRTKSSYYKLIIKL